MGVSASARRAARAAARSWRAADHLRRRRLPAFEQVVRRGAPVVRYLSPAPPEPVGGVKVIHQHVDLLNEMGVDAAVVHPRAGDGVRWFEHRTRVLAGGPVALAPQDVLVVPEFYAPVLGQLPPWCRKVVFNQSAHHTFAEVGHHRPERYSLYGDVPGLEGVMTVSRDSEELLAHTFPTLPVWRARPVVDERVFHPGVEPPGRRFAFTTTRRPTEQHLLLHVLRERGVDWEPVPLTGMSETRLAATLRTCAVFISFSELEGFGLPPAEAMASGCYVVGYPGGGGDEFFDPSFCSPTVNLLDLARRAEEAMARPLGELSVLGRRASRHVLDTYSSANLASDLLRVFDASLAVR